MTKSQNTVLSATSSDPSLLQLNLYNFQKLISGSYRGGYVHPKFRKDAKELSLEMRIRPKGPSRASGSKRRHSLESKEIESLRGMFQFFDKEDVTSFPEPLTLLSRNIRHDASNEGFTHRHLQADREVVESFVPGRSMQLLHDNSLQFNQALASPPVLGDALPRNPLDVTADQRAFRGTGDTLVPSAGVGSLFLQRGLAAQTTLPPRNALPNIEKDEKVLPGLPNNSKPQTQGTASS